MRASSTLIFRTTALDRGLQQRFERHWPKIHGFGHSSWEETNWVKTLWRTPLKSLEGETWLQQINRRFIEMRVVFCAISCLDVKYFTLHSLRNFDVFIGTLSQKVQINLKVSSSTRGPISLKLRLQHRTELGNERLGAITVRKVDKLEVIKGGRRSPQVTRVIVEFLLHQAFRRPIRFASRQPLPPLCVPCFRHTHTEAHPGDVLFRNVQALPIPRVVEHVEVGATWVLRERGCLVVRCRCRRVTERGHHGDPLYPFRCRDRWKPSQLNKCWIHIDELDNGHGSLPDALWNKRRPDDKRNTSIQFPICALGPVAMLS
eukprot:m.110076 g.110076  ORF g.110076 m.110076 type:complete len:317 (-) comp12868_c0_seq1:1019-1969(-)